MWLDKSADRVYSTDENLKQLFSSEDDLRMFQARVRSFLKNPDLEGTEDIEIIERIKKIFHWKKVLEDEEEFKKKQEKERKKKTRLERVEERKRAKLQKQNFKLQASKTEFVEPTPTKPLLFAPSVRKERRVKPMLFKLSSTVVVSKFVKSFKEFSAGKSEKLRASLLKSCLTKSIREEVEEAGGFGLTDDTLKKLEIFSQNWCPREKVKRQFSDLFNAVKEIKNDEIVKVSKQVKPRQIKTKPDGSITMDEDKPKCLDVQDIVDCIIESAVRRSDETMQARKFSEFLCAYVIRLLQSSKTKGRQHIASEKKFSEFITSVKHEVKVTTHHSSLLTFLV